MFYRLRNSDAYKIGRLPARPDISKRRPSNKAEIGTNIYGTHVRSRTDYGIVQGRVVVIIIISP